MKKTCLIVCLCVASGLAQNATKKAPVTARTASAPVLSDAFSKASLKALFAIQANSYKADEAYTDARTEMDAVAHPSEVVMLADLLSYQIDHSTNLIKRESLRAEITTDLCRQSNPQCSNPVFVQDQLIASSKYKELLSQDTQCVAALEDGLRNRISVDYKKSCP